MAGTRLAPLMAWTLIGASCVHLPAQAAGDTQTASIELVETAPVETDLDAPDLRPTHEVWLEMIGNATHEIRLGHFYASNQPGSRLEPVVAALEAAADRGVAVRFLAEETFHSTYPATLDRLATHDRIEVRRLDLARHGGGVLHAKYMIVDALDVFVGSANFDWRALEHIQELGVRMRSAAIAAAFIEVFELDWEIGAGTEPAVPATDRPEDPPHVRLTHLAAGAPVHVTPVFSPAALLPPGAAWDLPRLVDYIDSARETVAIQLLSYRTVDREGRYFDRLESALRRAAARGVSVRMIVADWSQRAGTIEGLMSLHVLPNIEITLMSIPRAAAGFVPFARVVHAKYMVVDERRAWIGTANWSRDYFYQSRNCGVLIEGGSVARRLQRFFDANWTSVHAERVDLARSYEPAEVGEPRSGR